MFSRRRSCRVSVGPVVSRSARTAGIVCLLLLATCNAGCLIPSINEIRDSLTHYSFYEVDSDPQGAHVFSKSGTYYGLTPTTMRLTSTGPSSGETMIRLVMHGYRERSYTWIAVCEELSEAKAKSNPRRLMVLLEKELERPAMTLPPVPIDQRLTLAVIDFDVGQSMAPDTGLAAADLCRHALAETQQYKLMDRNHMKNVLGEQDFAEAVRCDETECLVRYGKVLQAQRIVHGRITQLGQEYTLHIGLTDVNTSEMLSQVTAVVPREIEELSNIIPSKVFELVTTMTPQP